MSDELIHNTDDQNDDSTIFDQMKEIEEQISALKRQHASLKSSVSKEQFEADMIQAIISKVSAYHGALVAESVEENVEGFTVLIKISKQRAKATPVEEPAAEVVPEKGRKGRKKAEKAEKAETAEGADEKPAAPRVSAKELEQLYADNRLEFVKGLDALPTSDTPEWTKNQVEDAICQVSALYVRDKHWNSFRDEFLSDNGSAGRGKKFARK
jgi:regulator of replication initiation timing